MNDKTPLPGSGSAKIKPLPGPLYDQEKKPVVIARREVDCGRYIQVIEEFEGGGSSVSWLIKPKKPVE